MNYLIYTLINRFVSADLGALARVTGGASPEVAGGIYPEDPRGRRTRVAAARTVSSYTAQASR